MTSDRLISGTMVRDMVICERKVALDVHANPSLRDDTSPFVRMLWRDGLLHERDVLSTLDGPHADLRELDREERERKTATAMAERAPIILGSVIRHDDLIGMPDILRLGYTGYIALDVKSGSAVEGPRQNYKREYLAQVAHYARILGDTRSGPHGIAGIVDRFGSDTIYDLTIPLGRDRVSGLEVHAELLDRARAIVSGGSVAVGALSASCGMCDWRTTCRQELTELDDLTLVCGLGRAVRIQMQSIATSVTALGAIDPANLRAVPGVGVDRLRRFADRARLLSDPDAGPVVRTALELPANRHAIDFDVEADPLRGLVYLHGYWHEIDGRSEFIHFFAETPDAAGERQAFAKAVEHFRTHRDAHWFHYSAYEKTAYRDLQRRHPDVCDEAEIELIFAAGRCTDLYAVISARTDWPLSSYGIKSIAKACGFAWEDSDPGGAASIEWYDRYVTEGDPALRERIVAYNRDDVRASARVRESLAELELTGKIEGFRRPTVAPHAPSTSVAKASG
jgi:predicted RecB family nuclease